MNFGNVRLFLWFALFAFAWYTYATWQREHAPPPLAQTVPAPDDQPQPGDLPDLPPDAAGGANPGAASPQPSNAGPAELVRVRTDVLDLAIDLRSGDLVRADLLVYPVDKRDPNRVVRLLDDAPSTLFQYRTGLRGNTAEPTHLTRWRAPASQYTLAADADTLSVTLDWADNGAVTARKVYTFRRGSYEIGLDIELTNGGGAAWRGIAYGQLVRLHRPPERSYFSVDSYSYTGPVLFDGEGFDHVDVEEIAEAPVEQELTGGWFASIQHHFLAALVPPPADAFTYQASMSQRGEYVLSARGPVVSVEPGASYVYPLKLFVGPKLQEQLEAVTDKLDLTVDYGMTTPIAAPLFWLLSKVESWVGNWGWAIVIVTLLIKLAFYRLTAASGKSMAKMRELAPRMKQLQERYKEDRQALQQAMWELYKREKVNPAAGCLPILIQMPFFFAFYWVLVESVEMRQAPFILWINDLSSRDPFFVLPLLNGAAMYFQTRLNPAPPDPVQARVMQFMPIVFAGMFMFFPAGLVLYWLTNTGLSILQQWRINTIVHAERKKATA